MAGAALYSSDIREQDPLKQGLKPVRAVSGLQAIPIREQDPLKQGLKRHVSKVKR